MFRLKRVLAISMLLVLVLFAASAVSAIDTFVTGTIASGAQYDLWALDLIAGENVVATLVCDFDGVSRPLDPVLSVFFPGSDTSDTIFADVYNDDGYGSDDDPNGVDCDAFDSSRVFFSAPVTGTFIFRADGFGSSTGPYILEIHTSGGNPMSSDGRINPQQAAPVILYCDGTTINGYNVQGASVFSIENGGTASGGWGSIAPTADGRMQLASSFPDGKPYAFIFDGCPHGSYVALSGDPGTVFDAGGY